MNDLAIIDQSTALEVFTAEKGLDPYLQEVRDEIDSFIPDLTTDKGRKAIASMAAKVSKSKTALDSVGKNLVADLKTKPKLIDAERKRARDLMDAWRDEVRLPLTEWEQAKKAREDKAHETINNIRELSVNLSGIDTGLISEKLQAAKNFNPESLDLEFQAYAKSTKDEAVSALEKFFQERTTHEAEQAELAQLRKEKEEKEKKEREEAMKKEAAEKARLEAEREANRKIALQKELAEKEKTEARDTAYRLQFEAEERERKLKEAAEKEKSEAEEKQLKQQKEAQEREDKLKREADEAQQRIKQAEENAERAREQAEQRVLDAKKADDDARKAREADKQHRARINSAAVKALLDIVDEETAKAVMTKIIKREVPNVVINY